MRRWLRFNVVGILGAVVQLAALALFARVFGIQYVIATVLAVEVAVLHNFVWHEAWTWRELPAAGRWGRLLRFHVANGLVSIASNALLTWVFKRYIGLPLLVSNGAAIGLTAILNYVLASTWVFPKREHYNGWIAEPTHPSHRGLGTDGTNAPDEH